nr:uncharacterized protein LOC117842394 isoform X3 [Setaria viridis]
MNILSACAFHTVNKLVSWGRSVHSSSLVGFALYRFIVLSSQVYMNIFSASDFHAVQKLPYRNLSISMDDSVLSSVNSEDLDMYLPSCNKTGMWLTCYSAALPYCGQNFSLADVAAPMIFQ